MTGSDGLNLNLRRQIAIPSAFAAVAVPILLGIFEVQGWQMPRPIGIALIIVMLGMLTIAVALVIFEFVRAIRLFFQHRATSASWVSTEEPGRLDYEADGLRASKRFVRELDGLSDDTAKMGKRLAKHSREMASLKGSRDPEKKQRKANAAAKSINKSAVYIERRAALLGALVKDITRNFRGVIDTSELATEQERKDAEAFLATLRTNHLTTRTALTAMRSYRDTTDGLRHQNPSRSIRIAAARLSGGLTMAIREIEAHERGNADLAARLARKVGEKPPR